jgi:hypothetical protein
MTAPASRIRRTTTASRLAMKSRNAGLPQVLGSP